jgi:tellurite resistance protein
MSKPTSSGAHGSLGKDAFLALAAIGWSDGKLDADEAAGLVRAAREEGLAPSDLAIVESATKQRVDFAAIDRTKLSAVERTFIYACAVWLARLDGHVEPEEKRALHELGDSLGIPDGIRTHASAAALEVAQLPSGESAERYDFRRLRARVEERLAKHGVSPV